MGQDNTPSWSYVPDGNIITGFKRNNGSEGAIHTGIRSLIAASYEKFHIIEGSCMEMQWWDDFKRFNYEQKCPPGFALQGLHRKAGLDGGIELLDRAKYFEDFLPSHYQISIPRQKYSVGTFCCKNSSKMRFQTSFFRFFSNDF